MFKKKDTSFFKSITILASGSIIAQFIVIISAPLITRLFTPEEIGFYTYLLSILILFSPIINGRYDMSIIIEKKEANVFSLIKLSLIISFIGSGVITAGLFLYFKSVSLNHFLHIYIILIIFFLLFLSGIINILNAYNNRLKEYKLMSSIYIIRTTVQNFGAVLLGLFSFGLPGLLVPYLLGQLLGLKRQASLMIPEFKKIKKRSNKELLYVAKNHRTQPIYSVPAIFINNFSYTSITFFIGALFGIAQVGFYSISTRILGMPLSVISGNVSKVFFEAASREYDETGQFFQTLKKTTAFLVILAIPLVLAMYFVIPPLTTFFFGENWSVAGTYIKALAIMFSLRFIVTSLTPALHIVVKQKLELIIQALFIVASLSAYLAAELMNFNILSYLSLLNILFSIIYVIYYLVILKLSKSVLT